MRITTLLLSTLLLFTAACSKHEEEHEAAVVAPVQVAAATREPIRRMVEADAVLYPHDQSTVTPKISAPVQKFHVNRGDQVKQGQLLATLENRDLQAGVAESKGQLDQAEANLRGATSATIPEAVVKAQTDVQSAQQQLDAAQKLLESRQRLLQQGALARRQVDEAQVAYAAAKAQLDSAKEHLRTLEGAGKTEQIKGGEAQVAAARAHYQSTIAQLSYTEIRSPIDGVVSDRPLYAGEMASAGAPLLTVMDISRVVARANVAQNQAAAVKVGNSASIKLGDGGPEVPGRVTIVSPATDPSSTTIQVWVQAENPGGNLKPGANVHVSIVTATIKDATVVPASAILPGEEGGGTAVLTVSGDAAHLKKVETGVRDGDKVQILSGVSPGEQVVTVGGIGVEDKSKVRIVRAGEKGEGEK